eukprot:TRINITY_DN13563_c0_g1_i1.p3 TRINITY_DN13563_c0_g1~~TRINITY_DN13563_c0_g1_i1.p3  ORF type:complete len:105 (-),score=26.61 TRINITY_DN13563_c0_g1_i1:150-464(-)
MVDCVFFFFFFKQKTAYEMQRGLVGSEMCIRDRYKDIQIDANSSVLEDKKAKVLQPKENHFVRFVCNLRSEVSANNHVPSSSQFLVQFLFNKPCQVFMVAIFLF